MNTENRNHSAKPKNISKEDYENLPAECKGEENGKKLLFVGPPGSQPFVEGKQFDIKDGKVRCSHLGYCKACNNFNIINSKEMCRNCYVMSRRIHNMSEEEKRLYDEKKALRAKKKQLLNAKKAYPDNLLHTIHLKVGKGQEKNKGKAFGTNKIYSQEEKDFLNEAIAATLNGKEQNVLKMKYEKHMTFEDIGKELSVSRARASNINSQAISKLRAVYALEKANPKKST